MSVGALNRKSIPLLYQGISGSGLVPFIKVPGADLGEYGKYGRKVNLGQDNNPKPVNVINNVSTFNTKNEADSCRVLNINVMRNPKGDAFEGLQAPTGIGRHQPRGMAYMSDHPLNTRILVNRSNFFSTKPTTLGTPK